MEQNSVERIPSRGMTRNQVMKALENFKGEDFDWREGKTWSLVYYHSDEHYQLMKDAYTMYFSENGLNPMAFKSLKHMEKEVIRMTVNMLHGDRNCVGTMTSGGTESILLAVKTYRDRARKLKPWIRRPEMLVPETAHVAFDKAGDYFDVKVVHAKVGPDYRVDMKDVKRKLNRNTIMLVGSAPQYVQGVVDPIIELGQLALKKNIPLHVDACIGGFILPWVEKNNYNVPKWDFRVPGVTSISADLHKYGFTAKGASTVTYKNMDYLKYQFYVYENWGGGIYASPTMPGTKPGGAIASSWAALVSIGEEGYIKNAARIMKVVEKFKVALTSIPEIEIVGEPVGTILSWHSTDPRVSTYAIADQLEKYGWQVDRQQKPESIHMTVNITHEECLDEYIADIKKCVEYVRAHPESATSGQAAMYGMMAKIPFRGMIKRSVHKIMQEMYSAEGKIPDLEKKNPENIMDVVEKIGAGALEVKRQFDIVKDRILKK